MSVVRIYATTIMARDAVGNFCKGVADLLESSGFTCRIYAENIEHEDLGRIRKVDCLFDEAARKDLLFVNYSIFDPQLRRLLAMPNRKLCFFQNVTPPEFFDPWDAYTAQVCRQSKEQFAELAGFDLLMASTRFTAETLRAHVGRDRSIEVAPPFFRSWLDHRAVAAKREDGDPALLFVGRLVPNKRVEDLIRLLAALARIAPGARLTLVGGAWGDNYLQWLKELAMRLGLSSSQVMFAGSVSTSELEAHYSAASAFVCMSEHEGFCVPVVEAMAARLPVFAYAQPAVTEVLGGTGVLFREKDFDAMARKIRDVLSDPVTCTRVVAQQDKRCAGLLAAADGRGILRCFEALARVTCR